MDLFATAGSARAIAKFVEGGGLSNAVADLGIEAAEDALSKVNHADDKRSQVWSAVNHLESAQVAAKDAFQRGKMVLFYLRSLKGMEVLTKRAYIFGLQAICYRYLGEKELMDRALSGIDYIYDVEVEEFDWKNRSPLVGGPAVVGFFLSPFNWADFARVEWQGRRGTLPPYEKGWLGYTGNPYEGPGRFTVALRRRLNATWQEAPRDLVSFPK
jgi:hypothetical protein